MPASNVISADRSPFTSWFSSPSAFGRSLAELGRDQPVIFDEFMGAPVMLRHQDVSTALRNTSVFSTSFYGVSPMEKITGAQSGPEHVRQRRIHSRFFSPGACVRYTDHVRAVAEDAVATLAGRTEAELFEDLIARYPMTVFLRLLGIPDELGDQGIAWVRAIVRMLASPMNVELAEPGMKAYTELRAYAETLIDVNNLGDNLLGNIIRAFLEENCFSIEACSTAVVLLFLGGFETTTHMLSGTIASLLLNPTALGKVVADPDLLRGAIGEALRWANPSAGVYRLVAEDITVAGTDLAKNSMVYLSLAAAHYDADEYDNPEIFDIERHTAHLGFGLGPHYCAGAPLAEIEVTAVVTALLDEFPNIRIDPAHGPAFRYGAKGSVQHGTEALHVLL